MPNDFRKAGGYYQSMDGNDGNPGTDPNLPKRTPGDYALGATIIISGDTTASYNFSQRTSTIKADGTAVLRTSSDFLFGNPALGSGNKTFGERFNEGGYPIFIKLDGNTFRTQILGGFALFKNIVFEDGVSYENALGSQSTMEYCVLKNTAIDITGGTLSLDFCQLFNSANIGNDILSLKNSYVDTGTTVTMSSWFGTPATQFVNNNCQCVFTVGGIQYELKREKDGTPINPTPAANDLIAIDPTVYDRGNFSQSPDHFNLQKSDYWSASLTSPNVAAADSFGNIGGVYAVVGSKSTDTEFTSPAALTDLVFSLGDLIYDTGAGSGGGFILTQPIQVSNVSGVELGLNLFASLLAFDAGAAFGATNQNVPSFYDFLTGNAFSNPQRLTYELRFSTSLTQPVLDADYDNNAFIPAGNFFLFEYFSKPMVSTGGVGSGDPAYSPAGAVGIAPFWVQYRIILKENL